jgi:hypothetical protein
MQFIVKEINDNANKNYANSNQNNIFSGFAAHGGEWSIVNREIYKTKSIF